jgi:dTDP-4-dehydrorhamnose 3,5-epimerase
MYNEFKVKNSILFSEVKIIFPDIFNDHRGIIFTDYLESYFINTFENKLRFGHSKFAQNFQNVLRGIHGDFKSYKLIQCVYGEIFQVIVDCRKDSETYLKHECFNLNHNEPKMILIPPGFGNAFYVKSDFAIYNYKLSYTGEYNDYNKQFTYKWNDKSINIKWPNNSPILSSRDK